MLKKFKNMVQLLKQKQSNIKQNLQNYLNWIQNVSQKATMKTLTYFLFKAKKLLQAKGKKINYELKLDQQITILLFY